MQNNGPDPPIRVRFAPSPTGFLHVGNVRTALFNWLWARHAGGTFILRIEDTDAERSRPEFETQLVEDLQWLGLDWDEGVDRGGPHAPYRQSGRYAVYLEQARCLMAEDRVFPCFCTGDELERTRREQLGRNEMPRYPGTCRHLSRSDIAERSRQGSPSYRLRVRAGTVGFTDLVYGRIDVDSAQISDPVILRSDGSPTYNFACVVDDILMAVTHVIRGEGHLSNTHRQILLYECLASPPPRFAHLPTVLGPDGRKLSKRNGAASLAEFRSRGYLPDALLNYLALLGWPGPEEGKEILSRDEIVAQFDLNRVSKSPATFDIGKLNWVNRTYIMKIPPEDVAREWRHMFVATGICPPDPGPEEIEWLAGAIDAVRTQVDCIGQLPGAMEVLFDFDPVKPALEEDARAILASPGARRVAGEFASRVGAEEPMTPERYREVLRQIQAATGRRGTELFLPIRAALTGRGSGPELALLVPLFEAGSRVNLPRRVLSCSERIRAVLTYLETP